MHTHGLEAASTLLRRFGLHLRRLAIGGGLLEGNERLVAIVVVSILAVL